VQLTCVTIIEGSWPEGGSANLTVDDGSGPVTLRIDSDTNIPGSPPPVGQFSAIGIVGQFDTSEPYFEGYQLLPRKLLDILYDDCGVFGACCFQDGSCVEMTEDDCTTAGGDYWLEGVGCNPNPCLPLGACCEVDGSCYVTDMDTCLGNGDDWYGDTNPTCDPNPCPLDPTDYTICELSQDEDADGFPLHIDEFVRVTGIALMESNLWSPARTEFTITDASGCCIDVFSFDPTDPPIQRGDEVEVIGTMDFYNGKTEINDTIYITILSTGNELPPPTPVATGVLGSPAGEDYESCLIKLTCITVESGVWGTDENLTVNDGSGPVTLRTDNDTGIPGEPAPEGEFSAIGIGGQFDTSAPWDGGYQCMPRDINDILYDDCAVGACCYDDQLCIVTNEADCYEQYNGYVWMPEGDCDPNPCPPVAVEETTWGRIKAGFK
jgi:hypothetical protein